MEKRRIGVVAVIVIVGAIVALVIGCYYFYLEMNVARRFTVSANC